MCNDGMETVRDIENVWQQRLYGEVLEGTEIDTCGAGYQLDGSK